MEISPGIEALVTCEPFGEAGVILRLRETRDFVGIGYLALYASVRQAEIVGLYIDSRYRRRGLAKLLIQKLIELARERKLSEIAGTCSQDNMAANSLFESLNFQRWNKWVLRLESRGDKVCQD